MMRCQLLIFLLFVACFGQAQTSTKEVYKALQGSWVKQQSSWATEADQGPLPDFHKAYLRYEFTPKRDMLAYGTYFANGIAVDHNLNKRRLTMSFGRQFSIETIEADRLVIVELENGRIGAHSVRTEFIREHRHLAQLEIDPNTRLLKSNGDTVYLDSEKFHPKFQTKKYPDFHLYVHNQIKRFYPKGENYLFMTFEIDEAGVIGQFNVYAAANEKSTEKAIESIKGSEGRWTLPKQNGRGVKILVSYQDRFDNVNTGESLNMVANGGDIIREYSDVFVRAHQKAVKHYIKGEYEQALEFLAHCDQMNPDEPGKNYLKYLVYTRLENSQAAETLKADLLKTPLSFLVN